MDMNTNDPLHSPDQKAFWDSLKMDMINANHKLTEKDYVTCTERSFMFSIFFRGCTPLELAAFQELFEIKEYAYVILFELSESSKNYTGGAALDELKLYYLIKDSLGKKNSAIGPMITERFCILISHDTILTDEEYITECTDICRELIPLIENNFDVHIKAGAGSMRNIQSIYASFLDSLACMYYNCDNNIANYLDHKKLSEENSFDYVETEKRLLESIRLRKTEAYDYFGIIMEWIRPLQDDAKRNKIFEVLVLANHAMQMDSQSDVKYINYSSYVKRFMDLKGDALIEFAYQSFIYITSYVKPQSTIDYTNHIVKATREYLESHYTDDISLEDMASQVNISPQYFSKLIKKTTGFNFIDWLSMLRVKKAKELLTNSSLTVKEVCFMVGYKDPNYFSRIFKKRIGITPSEYVKTSSYLNNKN